MYVGVNVLDAALSWRVGSEVEVEDGEVDGFLRSEGPPPKPKADQRDILGDFALRERD